MHEVEVPQGTIRYRDSGRGEPIVFLHGAFVDGGLWRRVESALEPDFRCVVPDLPLGSHRVPMRPDADLTPPGLATLVADFIAALGLDGVTLVGNDTGGAIAQLVATRHPGPLARLVLTPADAYDNFLPPAFRYLQVLARVPGSMTVLGQVMRFGFVRDLPIAYGWLAKHGIPSELTSAWTEPVRADAGVRRDAAKVLKGISKRYTLEAAERLRTFELPTLLAWATEDRFFTLEYGQRLAEAIPNARLEQIDDAYTFVSLDQPERLADLVAAFMREPVGPPA